MKIEQIPALNDNYLFIIYDFSNKDDAIIIDPTTFGDAEAFLQSKSLNLTHILNTHHHPDHIGGNEKLQKKYGCEILGLKDDADRIPGISQHVQEGEILEFGELKFEVMFLPGHTNGHIAFFEKNHEILFVGDVLFSLGCGRLFEGTHEEMFNSLQKIKELPNETMIYCAHEYSEINCRFALSVDENNEDLQKHYSKICHLRETSLPTVPVRLVDEKNLNPFLKAQNIEEFQRLRKLRDVFR